MILHIGWGPLFYSSDPEAITLGKSARSVRWDVATSCVSKGILRNISKFAGVHLYTNCGVLVYSNEHFLSICPRVDGKRVIRLPEPKGVTDL